MRILFLLLLLSPVFALAQNSAYIRLTDSRGLQIKGESVLKGYERWIEATSFSTSGANNTELNFTMAVSGASADLRRAASTGEVLMSGQVTVLAAGTTTGSPVIAYTIKLEGLTVLSCVDAMGCNNILNTTVRLQATRIGWTYYDKTRTGTLTVSRKFGWDAKENKEWIF